MPALCDDTQQRVRGGFTPADRVSTAVGQRLAGCVRGGDTVARIGGDEFVVLLNDVNQTDDAVRVAERMLAAIRAPVRLGEREAVVSTSIGTALDPPVGPDGTDLIGLADAALYRARPPAATATPSTSR